MDARRGEEDLVPRFFRRHSTPICLADKPRLRRAAKKRLYAEGTRLRLASGIKVGELLTNAESSGAVLTIPIHAVADGAGVIDMALATITLQEVGCLTHSQSVPS